MACWRMSAGLGLSMPVRLFPKRSWSLMQVTVGESGTLCPRGKQVRSLGRCCVRAHTSLTGAEQPCACTPVHRPRTFHYWECFHLAGESYGKHSFHSAKWEQYLHCAYGSPFPVHKRPGRGSPRIQFPGVRGTTSWRLLQRSPWSGRTHRKQPMQWNERWGGVPNRNPTCATWVSLPGSPLSRPAITLGW